MRSFLRIIGAQVSTITIKSPHVIKYVCPNFGQYQKAYIRRHAFYLVIFPTIFPKLVLTWIKWKIANSAKTNIEVSF